MRWLVLAMLVACSSSPEGDRTADASGNGDGPPPTDGATGAPVLPPVNAKADYQLGGAYAPPTGVTVVSRDRNAAPATGIYNICYINGFQIQPDEEAFWTGQHPDLILKDNGTPVIDTEWNEILIDVSTAAKRDGVAAIVGAWIDGCKTAGFDAIEIDNLDSYSRSHALLSEDNNVAAMALFSAHAHAKGLAIAQKNSSELVARKAELATDFAVAEECNRYSECDAYRAGYTDHVIVIEYRQQDFATGCTAYPGLSILLRDLDLVTPNAAAYVYNAC
ncbi:MAG: endo alpha-1,4 polygalactosaminidase [Kofleriaceae bacterium]